MTTIPQDKWAYIKFLFLDHKFSEDEASWAADNNVDPRDALPEKRAQIMRILRNRRDKIEVLFEASEKTEQEVIDFVAERRRETAERLGEDDWNIFIEESP